MSKKIKALEIDALRKAFGGVKDYVIVSPEKPDASAEYDFRKNLRSKNIRVQLVKNTYAKKIFAEMGIQADGVWSGPTLLCWGGKSVKELSNAVDEQVKASRKDPKAPERYKIKTAIAEGQPIPIDVAKTLPTREEAIGDIVAALLGPAASIASALTGPATQLAGILKAIEEMGPAGGEADAATAAPVTDAPTASA